jgi:hypothetical protein
MEAAQAHRHGAQAVPDMPVTLDVLIADALRVVTAKQIVLPAPNPPPASRHALVRTMWFAGVSHNSFDVGTTLERSPCSVSTVRRAAATT